VWPHHTLIQSGLHGGQKEVLLHKGCLYIFVVRKLQYLHCVDKDPEHFLHPWVVMKEEHIVQ
jgi:hypothetical protein